MRPHARPPPRRLAGRLVLAALLAGAGAAPPALAASDAPTADGLRARHAALAESLRGSPYQRPLHIESMDAGENVRGDVYAVLRLPLGQVSEALRSPPAWCDVMMLHINTKDCAATAGPGGGGLGLLVMQARRHDLPLKDAYPLKFAWQTVQATPEFLAVHLSADEGPLGTRRYRIELEAVGVEGGRTFLHLGYSFGFGMAGRVAMQTYLATAGSGKVGFTVTGQRDGQPVYIGGVRGLVERNTMRYYLAVESYLEQLAAPAAEQSERRLQRWFAATEQFGRQLHEMDQAAYMTMKRAEVQRQRTAH